MFDAYLIPHIDALIHRVVEAQYLLMIDLTNGYWQIFLAPEVREKVVFVAPSGLCHFLKMPFGLPRARASFQRVMDKAPKGIRAYTVA